MGLHHRFFPLTCLVSTLNYLCTQHLLFGESVEGPLRVSRMRCIQINMQIRYSIQRTSSGHQIQNYDLLPDCIYKHRSVSAVCNFQLCAHEIPKEALRTLVNFGIRTTFYTCYIYLVCVPTHKILFEI